MKSSIKRDSKTQKSQQHDVTGFFRLDLDIQKITLLNNLRSRLQLLLLTLRCRHLQKEW